MSKTVTFTTSQKLDCGSCTPCNSCPSVILCLSSDELIAQIECPDSEGESDFSYAYIPGRLVYSSRTITSCGNATFTYGVSYDENLLVDPTTPLVSSNITGIFCQDCRTTYILGLLGDEPYIRNNEDGSQDFISPHGCVYPIGGGAGSFFLENTTEPATPVGGGYLYVESGVLKYKGSSGTVSILAPA